jgi:hypothetical protein
MGAPRLQTFCPQSHDRRRGQKGATRARFRVPERRLLGPMPQKTPKKTRALVKVLLNGQPRYAASATCDRCKKAASELFTSSDTRWTKSAIEGVFCRPCAPVTVNESRLTRSIRLAADELRKAVVRSDSPRWNRAQCRLAKLFSKARDAGLADGNPTKFARGIAEGFLLQKQAGTLKQRKRGPTPSGRAAKRDRARFRQALRAAETDAYLAWKVAGLELHLVLDPGDSERAFKGRAKRRKKSHPKADALYRRRLRAFLIDEGIVRVGRRRDESAT